MRRKTDPAAQRAGQDYAEQPITDVVETFRRTRAGVDGRRRDPRRCQEHHHHHDSGQRRASARWSLFGAALRTTRRMAFADGSVQTEERDGWYIDLPVDCFDWAARLEFWDTTPVAPGMRLIRRGSGRRGYPVIETIRSPNSTFINGAAVTVTSTQELVAVSEQVLDASLFTVPPGYRPALRTPGGAPDMSRPDTLVNRAVVTGRHSSPGQTGCFDERAPGLMSSPGSRRRA